MDRRDFFRLLELWGVEAIVFPRGKIIWPCQEEKTVFRDLKSLDLYFQGLYYPGMGLLVTKIFTSEGNFTNLTFEVLSNDGTSEFPMGEGISVETVTLTAGQSIHWFGNGEEIPI